MERLRKPFAEVETDEDPDFENEDNGFEDVLEEVFSDHESFSEHDTKSEEDGDSGKEDGKNLELFSSKERYEWRKQNLGKILCRTYLEQKDQKSWELFITDNMMHLTAQ
ncbi:hypothetical protein AVEN_231800-1 [Araneus ventricosus]|uniref:Uncharacterized protein n=1 Tax=Araneus ventricosus TaxID=182803 RepID=A0A4Y2SLJ7_ARAVE|nr:hypothetical protein AVEN_135570-1 [Araneus ventricosus]GBN88204.1 hypothetical protein AVEN_210711-1 [Araneus ventricosus]GBN92742.1 hypothetical protein AVEN_191429-1 [Araneus ventricosus]GBN92781.1 hypothetical protein AVEN_231800-1 [Araneus ventricosus]